MEGYKAHETKKLKPEFLYHGSTNAEITEFTPKISVGSGEKYGEKIYATPNKALATVFLCKLDKPWSAGMYSGIPVAVLPIAREEFLETDFGGTLYTLPSASFEQNANELAGDEWASSKPIEPNEKKFYPSALDAMLEHGVQVYFVDDHTKSEIADTNDGGASVLRTLISENQRQNRNVLSF